MNNTRLQGKIRKAKNGYLCYDIDNAKLSFFPVFCQLLEEQFGAVSNGATTSFVSEIIGDVTINNVELGCGRDNWSGVYLMSLSQEGDGVVKDVARFIELKIKKERFECHVHM